MVPAAGQALLQHCAEHKTVLRKVGEWASGRVGVHVAGVQAARQVGVGEVAR